MKLFLLACLVLLPLGCFASKDVNLTTDLDVKPVPVPSIDISYFFQQADAGQLTIDSQVIFILSDEMKKALGHEIPLYFDVELRVLEENELLKISYQKRHHSISYQISLSHSNYDNLFIITNMHRQSQQIFNTLQEALRTFGTLRNFNVMNLADFDKNKAYSIEFRVKFNRWMLPTALIINSFIDPNWYLSSDWHRVKIKVLDE